MTSRRTFLGFFGALLTGTFLLPFAGAARAKDAVSPDLFGQFADLFPDFGNAVHIGRRYLELTPCERDVAALASAVSRNVGGSAPARPIDRTRFREEAAQAVRRDFETGNVVTIDGWVLSRTEAQICGLVTLERAALAA